MPQKQGTHYPVLSLPLRFRKPCYARKLAMPNGVLLTRKFCPHLNRTRSRHRQILASVSSLNPDILSFHAKNGFEECGRLPRRRPRIRQGFRRRVYAAQNRVGLKNCWNGADAMCVLENINAGVGVFFEKLFQPWLIAFPRKVFRKLFKPEFCGVRLYGRHGVF